MKILKLCVAVVASTIAIIFCIHLSSSEETAFELQRIPESSLLDKDTVLYPKADTVEETQTIVEVTTDITIQEFGQPPTALEVPAPSIIPEIEDTQPVVSFAEITIITDKKTGSYTVMPNVNENTLKTNVGWLPSSSMPGKEGICVLMGHRDTDFEILQYLKIGDKIIVVQENSKFVYEVYKIDIAQSDSELRFDVVRDTGLALVTCYPFRYTGHAPQKFVAFCSCIS